MVPNRHFVTIVGWCAMVMLPPRSAGDITLECVALNGTVVTGGQSVVVECNITTDIDQVISGLQLDLACSLPSESFFQGEIRVAQLEVDTLHVNPPFLFSTAFGGSGYGLTVLGTTCLLANAPFACVSCIAEMTAGKTAYVGTLVYEVSACAAGDFRIVLENFSDPPSEDDVTHFDDGIWNLIPFEFTPLTLTVETGTCCDGFSCLEDNINRTCCEQNNPSATFVAGATCTNTNPCNQACCLSNGPCAMMNPQSCADQGGAPLGREDECSTPEACCFTDGHCETLDPLCCVNAGGTSLGPDSTCEGDVDDDGVDASCGDPCPLDPNDDSDGDGLCDSDDLCPGADDRIDADSNGIPDCLEQIPTVSQWGLIVLTLLLLTMWKIRFGRLVAPGA